jgi:uncharacterized membrane protein
MKGRATDAWRLAAFAALAAAAGWRLAVVADRPLWFDEAFTWRLTQFGWGELLERARQDYNPPLYYFLLKLWAAAFGDSVAALRLLSEAWFGVLLAAAFFLCREVAAAAPSGRAAPGARDAGLTAALWLAASPFVLRYAEEARMYMQAAALSLLSAALLLRALREAARPAPWWAAWALCAAAAAYTHSFALFGVLTEALFLAGLFLLEARGGWRRLLGDRRLRWAVAAGLLFLLLFAPWVPTLLEQRRRAAADYWAPLTAPGDRGAAAGFLLLSFLSSALFDRTEPRITIGCFAVAALAAAALTDALVSRERGRLLVASLVVGPLALLVLAVWVSGRVVIGHRFLLTPFCALPVAAALALARLPRKSLRWGLAFAAAAFLAAETLPFYWSLDLAHRTGCRGAADEIAANLREGDLVVVDHPFAYFSLRYYARGRFTPRLLWPATPFPTYAGTAALRPDDFLSPDEARDLERGRRAWAVLLRRPQGESTPAPPPRLWAEGTVFEEPNFGAFDVVLSRWTPEAGDGRSAAHTPPDTSP